MTNDIHAVSFRNGDHICLFYRDPEEQMETAVPFVKLGLLRNERCLIVLTKSQTERLLELLDQQEIDVKEQVSRGALVLASPEEAYLAGGKFDRVQMMKLLDDGMHEALKLGFTGFRGTGDLSWAARDTHVCGEVVEYERMLDRYYPGQSCLGICMYDANLFSADQLDELLKAHRSALMMPAPGKRAIRIRNGGLYGDVIFDRESPSLYHYAVQKDNSANLLNFGQERSLTAALLVVESSLGSA